MVIVNGSFWIGAGWDGIQPFDGLNPRFDPFRQNFFRHQFFDIKFIQELLVIEKLLAETGLRRVEAQEIIRVDGLRKRGAARPSERPRERRAP